MFSVHTDLYPDGQERLTIVRAANFTDPAVTDVFLAKPIEFLKVSFKDGYPCEEVTAIAFKALTAEGPQARDIRVSASHRRHLAIIQQAVLQALSSANGQRRSPPDPAQATWLMAAATKKLLGAGDV